MKKPTFSFHISDYHVQYMNNYDFFNFTIALVSFKWHPIDGETHCFSQPRSFSTRFCH